MHRFFIACHRQSTLETLAHLFSLSPTELGYEKIEGNAEFFAMVVEPGIISISKPPALTPFDELPEAEVSVSRSKESYKAVIAQFYTCDTVVNISEGTLESEFNLCFLLKNFNRTTIIASAPPDFSKCSSLTDLVSQAEEADLETSYEIGLDKKECGYWSSILTGRVTAYLRSGQIALGDIEVPIHRENMAPVGEISRLITDLTTQGISGGGGRAQATPFTLYSILAYCDSYPTYQVIELLYRLQSKGVLLNVEGSPVVRLTHSGLNMWAGQQARLLKAEKSTWLHAYQSTERFGITVNPLVDSNTLQRDEKVMFDWIVSHSEKLLEPTNSALHQVESLLLQSTNTGELAEDYPARLKQFTNMLYHGWLTYKNDNIQASEALSTLYEAIPFAVRYKAGQLQAAAFKDAVRESLAEVKKTFGSLDPSRGSDYLKLAPAEKSVAFARKIEREAGVVAPYRVYCNRSDCQVFIDQHKGLLPKRKPTNAMIARLDWLQEKKGLQVGDPIRNSYYDCYNFLKKHQRYKR